MSRRPTQASIAHTLGVSRPRVSQLAKLGMPLTSTAAAVAWYAEHVSPRLCAGKIQAATLPAGFGASRARAECARAEMTEHRAAVMRGELVDQAGVLRGEQHAAELLEDAIVLRFPTRHARELAGITDPWKFECCLRELMRECLADLSAQLLEAAPGGARQ